MSFTGTVKVAEVGGVDPNRFDPAAGNGFFCESSVVVQSVGAGGKFNSSTLWVTRSGAPSTIVEPLSGYQAAVDTTVANLIAHQLIGETFANQLDEVVHHSVDEMLNDESFAAESVEAYRDTLTSPQTGEAWKRWPCLSKQLGVGLAL